MKRIQRKWRPTSPLMHRSLTSFPVVAETTFHSNVTDAILRQTPKIKLLYTQLTTSRSILSTGHFLHVVRLSYSLFLFLMS